jgi:hypothetical protein
MSGNCNGVDAAAVHGRIRTGNWLIAIPRSYLKAAY